MNIRPATEEDIAARYGAKHVPVRMLALVDGGVIGLAGAAWCADGVFAASWLSEKAKKRPAAVMRFALAALGIIESVDADVYATADAREQTACRVLQFLGFEKVGGLYVYRKADPRRLYARRVMPEMEAA